MTHEAKTSFALNVSIERFYNFLLAKFYFFSYSPLEVLKIRLLSVSKDQNVFFSFSKAATEVSKLIELEA